MIVRLESVGEYEPFRIEIRPTESYDLLVLSGEITLDAAGHLREAALAAAAGAREVAVDWRDARHVSAGALQLMLALRAALETSGRALSVAADNPAMRRTLEVTGLSQLFPIREVPG
jgi:anti-anti-sigma factor